MHQHQYQHQQNFFKINDKASREAEKTHAGLAGVTISLAFFWCQRTIYMWVQNINYKSHLSLQLSPNHRPRVEVEMKIFLNFSGSLAVTVFFNFLFPFFLLAGLYHEGLHCTISIRISL